MKTDYVPTRDIGLSSDPALQTQFKEQWSAVLLLLRGCSVDVLTDPERVSHSPQFQEEYGRGEGEQGDLHDDRGLEKRSLVHWGRDSQLQRDDVRLSSKYLVSAGLDLVASIQDDNVHSI